MLRKVASFFRACKHMLVDETSLFLYDMDIAMATKSKTYHGGMKLLWQTKILSQKKLLLRQET